MSHTGDPSVLLLNRSDVVRCIADISPVAVVRDALQSHARGLTQVPAEAQLRWVNSQGASCRSLGMPGELQTESERILGIKVINAAISNPIAGIARAGGFTTLFDPETARPVAIVEGGLISALRTAAYTILSIQQLASQNFDRVAIVGCGALAAAHVNMIEEYFPAVQHLQLFDKDGDRARELAHRWTIGNDRRAVVAATAAEAIRGAPVVVTLTTSDIPYISHDMLSESVFVAHVSLGDVTQDAFINADHIYVDDMDLVAENPQRVLGGMLAEARPSAKALKIAGTLGGCLVGDVPAHRAEGRRIISNPFGMSILDLAVASQVVAVAQTLDIGTKFRFVD